jgi:hypothetical protein
VGQHAPHLDYETIQIGDCWQERLTSTEREELLRERFSALGSVKSIVDVATPAILLGTPKQVKTAYNNGEEIVEIVSDASRQATQCLQPLRMVKLCRRRSLAPQGPYGSAHCQRQDQSEAEQRCDNR